MSFEIIRPCFCNDGCGILINHTFVMYNEEKIYFLGNSALKECKSYIG